MKSSRPRESAEGVVELRDPRAARSRPEWADAHEEGRDALGATGSGFWLRQHWRGAARRAEERRPPSQKTRPRVRNPQPHRARRAAFAPHPPPPLPPKKEAFVARGSGPDAPRSVGRRPAGACKKRRGARPGRAPHGLKRVGAVSASDSSEPRSKCADQYEGREIRTPNLLIWSQTRCRCAIPPLNTIPGEAY